jgi:hypothetical protein
MGDLLSVGEMANLPLQMPGLPCYLLLITFSEVDFGSFRFAG